MFTIVGSLLAAVCLVLYVMRRNARLSADDEA